MNKLEQQVVDACHVIANAVEGHAQTRAEVAVRLGRMEQAIRRVPMHEGESGLREVDEAAFEEALLEVAAIRAALGLS